MADPASGVITLITFSLVVIRETKKFIQETRDVPNELQRRLRQLEGMETYMLVLEKHCKDGPSCGDDVLLHITDSLSSLRPQLEYVQNMVKDQASRDSDTLYKKFKMQIRKKISEKEVIAAMEELAYHQSHMALFMNLGIFQLVTNINRRTSEVSPTSQSPSSNHWLWPNDTESPMNRTLSEGTTIYETSSVIEHTPSQGTRSFSQSQTSLEANVPQTSSSGGPGLSSGPRAPNPDIANACSDIHYQIIQASDDDDRLCAVQQILDDPHTDASVIESKDAYGRTPLCVAVRLGDTRLVRVLILEYGADVNATDSQPWSVLEHALAQKRDACVEFLIERGVDQESVKEKRLKEALGEILQAIELKGKQSAKRKASNSEPTKSNKTNRTGTALRSETKTRWDLRMPFGSKRLQST